MKSINGNWPVGKRQVANSSFPLKLFSIFLGFAFLACGGLSLVPQADAQTWIQLTPSGTPPLVRGSSSTVFDPGTNQLIIFGGRSGTTNLNDLWRLSGANGLLGTPAWVSVAPSGSLPSPRWVHEAAYDQVNNRMIVFGGARGSSSPCSNDVWVLTNANGQGGTPTWSPLTTSGGSPGVRFNFSAVYNATTNSLIVYGGNNCFSGATYNDVWVLSNANGLGGTATWSLLNPAGVVQAHNRDGHEAVYDEANNRMIVFGGRNTTLANVNDSWVLTNANGQGGTPTWIPLLPSGLLPSPRGTAGIYDSASNRMVIFGGATPTGVVNDVWALSNANGQGGAPVWLQLNPTGTLPPARVSHSAVYDESNNRMIIFGGNASPNLLNDVWVLTDANGISNQPPVADAGPDQVVECASYSGALVTLDGTGSSDPDGDDLAYEWTNSFGTVTGPTPTVTLPIGDHLITLIVDDGNGETDTDTVRVVVQDTTVPTVTASLEPIGKVRKNRGDFRVVFSCADACDENPMVLADINGISVTDGQVVTLKVKNKKQKIKMKHGKLEIKAPSFLLTVHCSDASGNEEIATATPQFRVHHDDDDDDDKDDDEKEKEEKDDD